MTRLRLVALAFAAPLSAQSEEPPTTRPMPATATLELATPLASWGRLGGVAADLHGNVYVSNFRREVWRVMPNGQVALLADDLEGSSGNTISPQGNLLQCSFNDGKIIRIDRNGERSVVARGLKGPIGLVANADGELFVCSCPNNLINRVSVDGTVDVFARSDDFACPNGIAMGKGGELFVVSFNNSHVVHVTPDGKTERFVTLPARGNAHVVFVDGVLYVTQIRTNRIYRIDGDGEFAVYAGSGGLGLKDGPLLQATLSRPNGVAVSADGRRLITNNLDGVWRSDEPGKLVLRTIPLPAKPHDE